MISPSGHSLKSSIHSFSIARLRGLLFPQRILYQSSIQQRLLSLRHQARKNFPRDVTEVLRDGLRKAKDSNGNSISRWLGTKEGEKSGGRNAMLLCPIDAYNKGNILREDKKSFGFEAKPFSAVTEFFCSNLQNRRGKAGKSIERACSALALVPSAKLRRDKSVTPGVIGIVGRMKWYEALVDIASVRGCGSGVVEPLFPAGIEVSRAGEGDAFLEQANQKFHFEFRTSTSCCSWCFTISIGNERRSGGTCGTTYWITPVRHEAADAESAPMPLAMPCLVPRHGGGSVARHEHRAKGRLSNSSEPPYLT
ncbi:hypothetical protein Sango_2926300 [Sesamum angolense]|uniref:Uncharacterized protein n=1 Tax=Sesamum angolense TaxID=2727404 RepID=A0AAE1T5B5_9LAMI|nr:hypothetical protein Sango_2926300 [Sesamum angolense]